MPNMHFTHIKTLFIKMLLSRDLKMCTVGANNISNMCTEQGMLFIKFSMFFHCKMYAFFFPRIKTPVFSFYDLIL